MPLGARDWSRLIGELEAAGFRGALACFGGEELQRLRGGGEPSYSDGELLLALHQVLLADGEKAAQNAAKPPATTSISPASAGLSFLEGR